jgi:hypothetical protein
MGSGDQTSQETDAGGPDCHRLNVLHYLLGMPQLEGDERLRLCSKRKLS